MKIIDSKPKLHRNPYVHPADFSSSIADLVRHRSGRLSVDHLRRRDGRKPARLDCSHLAGNGQHQRLDNASGRLAVGRRSRANVQLRLGSGRCDVGVTTGHLVLRSARYIVDILRPVYSP